VTEDLFEFACSQVKRLSGFRGYGSLEPETLGDYREWLETKCQTAACMKKVIDEAIRLEKLPTIPDLDRIHRDLFPPPNPADAQTPEQRAHLKQYVAMLDAAQQEGIEERRAKFRALQEREAKRQQAFAPRVRHASEFTAVTREDVDREAEKLRQAREKKKEPDDV
jgi:hypothetical protein